MLLLVDATEALGVLDAERLGSIAARLQTLLDSQTGVTSTAEIASRQRVFASVLRATAENIAILRRVACSAAEVPAWGR